VLPIIPLYVPTAPRAILDRQVGDVCYWHLKISRRLEEVFDVPLCNRTKLEDGHSALFSENPTASLSNLAVKILKRFTTPFHVNLPAR